MSQDANVLVLGQSEMTELEKAMHGTLVLRGGGKLHEPGTLFLRLGAGTATDPVTGEELYFFGVEAATFVPLVTCIKSRRTFSLSWEDLIKLAKMAGVDRP